MLRLKLSKTVLELQASISRVASFINSEYWAHFEEGGGGRS